jgi:predicted nucleic acid-binding protein
MSWKLTLPTHKVVSNTTPILSLLKIDKLDLLRTVYGSIIVPQAVYREIETGKDKDYYADLDKIDWIKIEELRSPGTRVLLFDLDDGEAETLVLAQEQDADLVIIDEKCGRRYAVQMGLTITGTAGVLLRAKKQGIITEIAPLLNELQAKQSWLNPKFIAQVLKLAGE